ncbi:hypothetical protein ElyMa_004566700 [Elysia marginata]|uniref:Immunoglobulin V-set domain-containing protein n=1 Tax=Elysia marginata TaxID=1093978 RepID=A0AAV4HRY1_9GAST|nr:hypothetical protein ElyMa_004566700 [Elysia marginata]
MAVYSKPNTGSSGRTLSILPQIRRKTEPLRLLPPPKSETANLEDSHSLTVNQLETSDAGLYVCHLHSDTGDASHTCELRVEESHRRSRTFLSKSLREPLEQQSVLDTLEAGNRSFSQNSRYDIFQRRNF